MLKSLDENGHLVDTNSEEDSADNNSSVTYETIYTEQQLETWIQTLQDAPLFALDTETQAKLMDALSGLEHTMSVVLITHRPELLGLVDRVIGIEDGAIKRRDGAFRRSDPAPAHR